jgi:hypothetical protein
MTCVVCGILSDEYLKDVIRRISAKRQWMVLTWWVMFKAEARGLNLKNPSSILNKTVLYYYIPPGESTCMKIISSDISKME